MNTRFVSKGLNWKKTKYVNADSFNKFQSLFTNICECQNTHGKFIVDFWSDAYNKIFTFNWKLSA